MEVLQICLLLVFFGVSKGQSWPNFQNLYLEREDPNEHIPQCSNDTRPCKMMVRELFSNGSIMHEFASSHICACADGAQCPDQWEQDPSRSITRSLRSQEKLLTLQMKFCEPVQPLRTCRPHEVALILTGNSILPSRVDSINCRCNQDQAVFLQRVIYQRNYRRKEHFTCSMPVCGVAITRRAVCQLNTHTGTFYPCQCPDGLRCKRANRIISGCRP